MSAQPTPRTGIERIVAERQRQLDVEGWDANHDAGQAEDLTLAAVCYALPEHHRKHSWPLQALSDSLRIEARLALWGLLWPWADQWWKPTPENRVRELEKAGALIAAAIDDLLREASDAAAMASARGALARPAEEERR